MSGARSRPRLGAHVEAGGVLFAAFTLASTCQVQLVDAEERELTTLALEPLGDGYFERLLPDVKAGALYWFIVDGRKLPDPYARCLPRGVHGPGQVLAALPQPQDLRGLRKLAQQVIYELHIGTFTDVGTFAAAKRQLPRLAELGITTIELMPVVAFAGERGWGYDGVAPFAPHCAYGTPEELAELVAAAHELGLGVLLDVVYNHFGPSGNYLAAYARSYFSEELKNAWGKAPNFTEPALRQLVLESARYWLEDVGFDGLRLDATHAIIDPSPKHIITELAELAHGLTSPRLLCAEDDRNEIGLATIQGVDALWADDFHHQVRVTLTGERDGYYAAYEPSVQGIADVINRGWLYTGQRSPVSGRARGRAADTLPAEAFVYCIQNHDQIGNRPLGDRLASSVGQDALRAASLLLLFLPMTPLLFMGQEWGSTTPFLYFTDHEAELGRQVSEGRRKEFSAFPQFSDPSAQSSIPDPQARSTFLRSKLKWSDVERPEHRITYELYRTALALRRSDPVLSTARRDQLLAEASGAVLLVHRWHKSERRVLLVNFGATTSTLSGFAPHLGLRSPRALLRSSPKVENELAPYSAILLAGEGNLAGLVGSDA